MAMIVKVMWDYSEKLLALEWYSWISRLFCFRSRDVIKNYYILLFLGQMYTYDHRSVKTGHPVRSAIHKH
jgi:hypothetical protein